MDFEPSPGSIFLFPGQHPADAIRRELREARLQLIEPLDSTEAATLLPEVEFDLLLVEPDDLERMSLAVTAIETLRKDPPPIVVLANYELNPLEACALYRLGATEVVFPPHHPGLVLAKIGALLRLQRRIDAARELSVRDELTGLYNRRFFLERLEQEVARSVRTGKSLGLVLFDVDRFKKINDTYGHPTGDAVLRHIAGIAYRHTRKSDVLARVGGDEFALLLSANTLDGARVCAEALRSKIAASHPDVDIDIEVSSSFGVAAYPHPKIQHPMEDLIATADQAMLSAKGEGRDRVASIDDAAAA